MKSLFKPIRQRANRVNKKLTQARDAVKQAKRTRWILGTISVLAVMLCSFVFSVISPFWGVVVSLVAIYILLRTERAKQIRAAIKRAKRTRRSIGGALALAVILLSFVFGVISLFWGVVMAVLVFYVLLRVTIVFVRERVEIVDLTDNAKVKARLIPGEKAIIATREHPFAILVGLLNRRTSLTLLVGGVVGFFVLHSFVAVIAGAVLALALRVTWRVYVYLADIAVLSNYGLFAVTGPLTRDMSYMPLNRIGSHKTVEPYAAQVAARLGLTEKPIGYIEASGIEEDFKERFQLLPDVNAFERALRIALHA